MYYDIYILGCLMQRPHYGYEIKKKLAEAMSACTTISNNTLYPILKKYENAGATIKSVEAREGAPSRVVYSITDKGRRMFVDALWHFDDAMILNREDFCMRLCYFDLLSKEARTRVIALREAYIHKSLALLDASARLPDEPFTPRAPRMAAFHRELLAAEQRVLDDYKERIDDPCLITEEGTLRETPLAFPARPYSSVPL